MLLSSRHFSQYNTVFEVGSKIVNFLCHISLTDNFFINTKLVMNRLGDERVLFNGFEVSILIVINIFAIITLLPNTVN